MLVKHILNRGLLLKNAGAVSRAAYHVGGHHSTMNDLPTPAGDWKEQHSRKNTQYNIVLLTGILVLAGTISLAKSTGAVQLNYSGPKTLD